jgi:NitT/TauT family transport system permease protein
VTAGRTALVVFAIAFWQFGSGRFFDPFYAGSPSNVARVLIHDFADPGFYRDLWVTGVEVTLGSLFGAVFGVGLGVMFARWRMAADIFDPFFVAFNSIPRIALAPLLIIWFGIDLASKVVLSATLVFFLMFFNTLSGIRSVDPALIEVSRVMGASDRQIFLHVLLPGAASWIIGGLKMSLPFALIGVIVGEFLAASSGLGFRLNMYSTSYNTNGTFAMLVVMMVLMMLMNSLMSFLERRALHWRAGMNNLVQAHY